MKGMSHMSTQQRGDLFLQESEFREILKTCHRYYSSHKNRSRFENYLRSKIGKCLLDHIDKAKRREVSNKVLKEVLGIANEIPRDKNNMLPYQGKASTIAKIIDMLHNECTALYARGLKE